MSIINIAVLITVHNRKFSTARSLKHLFDQRYNSLFKLDVFLVDDGSTDGTQQLIADSFPDVKIIKGNGDLYWNRGMHLAWSEAEKVKAYDYYLWINDDTYIYNFAIHTLILTSCKLNQQAIIVGSICSIENKQFPTYGGRLKNGQLIKPSADFVQCEFFNGNLVLVPKYVYNIIGKNDDYFHHSLGDFDYGLRALKSGIRSFIAPGFLGECNLHPTLPNWCNPQVKIGKRFEQFRTPIGRNPEEYFVYEVRHYGIFKACIHYLTIHLRVLFPFIWVLYRKNS